MDENSQEYLLELEYISKKTVADHLFATLWYFVQFQFTYGFAHILWAIERLTESGDYGPEGSFNSYGFRWWVKGSDILDDGTSGDGEQDE